MIGDLKATGAQVLTAGEDLFTYRYDAQGEGDIPVAVVVPDCVRQASDAVRVAGAHGLPVIPQAAATNLSGAALVRRPAVLCSMVRMNRLLHISSSEALAVVQPGLTNRQLQNEARPYGLFFPPDPASYQVSTLGGNIALNAGGIRGFKYGVTGHYVVSMQVVLSDGSVARLGGPGELPMGYDLAGLLTGSEGTLGVVTEATLRLAPLRPETRTVLALFDAVEEAGWAVQAVIASGLVPVALELLDQPLLRAAGEYMKVELDAEAMLLVEVEGFPGAVDDDMAQLTEVLKEQGARNLRRARTPRERERLWTARRNAAAAATMIRPALTNEDVTVPPGRLVDMLRVVKEIARRHRVLVGNVFHAGDGNFHPLVLYDDRDQDEADRAHRATHEIMQHAIDLGGTVTGEHGVGENKLEAMSDLYSESTLEYMFRVKECLDPRGLLNPGKAVPEPTRAQPGNERNPMPERAWAAGGGNSIPEIKGEPIRPHGGENAFGLDKSSLTAVIPAGAALGEVRDWLERHGLHLPWGRWEPDCTTLGSLVARNPAGPGREKYRRLGDGLLGTEILTGRGHIIRPGGRTIKNVAGYNLSALMVGSLGTLGVLREACFRVYPLPQEALWLQASFDDLNHMEEILTLTARVPAELISVVLVRDVGFPDLSGSGWRLLLELEGRGERGRAAVEAVASGLSSQLGLRSGSWRASDGDVRRIREHEFSAPDLGGVVRLNAWARDLPELLSRLPSGPPTLVFPGQGSIEIAFRQSDWPALEDWIQYPGRARIVVRQGPRWPRQLSLLEGLSSEALSVMERVKAALDPDGVFPSLPVGRCSW